MAIEVKRQRTMTGHKEPVYTLAMVDGTSTFFSGAGDGLVVQWDLGKPDGEVIATLSDSVYAMLYAPDRDVLVVGHNYDGLHLIDWKNKKEVGSLKLTTAAIFDIQPVGKDWVIATGDGGLVVVDPSGLQIKSRLAASPKSARSIAVHPSGGQVAAGFSDNFIRVFDVTLKQTNEFAGHESSVFVVKYSPDGKWLLSGSRDAHLKVWSVAENYVLHKEIVAHLYAINHLAFSPDGKHFVTCSMDRTVKVWRTEDLTLLKVIDKARHAGHSSSVNKLLWTSVSNQVVSASDDRTISVWDVIF